VKRSLPAEPTRRGWAGRRRRNEPINSTVACSTDLPLSAEGGPSQLRPHCPNEAIRSEDPGFTSRSKRSHYIITKQLSH
ncbi:MAG: hypothetical protein ACYTF1_11280, partial [Planctomycetota bacterium]